MFPSAAIETHLALLYASTGGGRLRSEASNLDTSPRVNLQLRSILDAVAAISVSECRQPSVAVTLAITSVDTILYIALPSKGKEKQVAQHLLDIWDILRQIQSCKVDHSNADIAESEHADPDVELLPDLINSLRVSIYRFSFWKFHHRFSKHLPAFKSFVQSMACHEVKPNEAESDEEQEMADLFRELVSVVDRISDMLAVVDVDADNFIDTLEFIGENLEDLGYTWTPILHDKNNAIFEKYDSFSVAQTNRTFSLRRYLQKLFSFHYHCDALFRLVFWPHFPAVLSQPPRIHIISTSPHPMTINMSPATILPTLCELLPKTPLESIQHCYDSLINIFLNTAESDGLDLSPSTASSEITFPSAQTHPVCSSIAYHYSHTQDPFSYIGTSKAPCYACRSFLETFISMIGRDGFTHVKPFYMGHPGKTTQVTYPWRFPVIDNLKKQDSELLDLSSHWTLLADRFIARVRPHLEKSIKTIVRQHDD